MKSLRVALTAFLFAILALPAFAQQGAGPEPGGPPYGYGYRMWGHSWDGGWGWHPGFFFAPLCMLFVLAGIILVVWLVRGFGHGAQGHSHGRYALDTLDQRFAKGEIDKAEFEEKRKLLA